MPPDRHQPGQAVCRVFVVVGNQHPE
jgi:hypothetical protein